MVNRQKNLLEAFTASANAEKAASEDPNPSASPSGGPFAPEPRDRGERPRGTLTDTLLHPDNRGGLLALVGVLVTLAFLAGRMTAGDGSRALAAGEGTDPAAARGEQTAAALPQADPSRPAPPAEEAKVPISAAEKALADTRNKYTIKLVEYRRHQDEDLAWNTLHYLEDQGLPAASLYRGQRLFLVLGAAPNQVDLDDLLRRAKTMDGPPPRNKKTEFSDAYVEKIDNLYDR